MSSELLTPELVGSLGRLDLVASSAYHGQVYLFAGVDNPAPPPNTTSKLASAPLAGWVVKVGAGAIGTGLPSIERK